MSRYRFFLYLIVSSAYAQEVDAIVAFLHSLEGTVPEKALRLPILPTATLATPKPVFK